ncbi:hypothetical protein C3H41_08730 [Campylobacter jejuni]|uniref:hypothetical protein n=1 Tax=Campylobacter jejuni TaxID=197 RepID=UPI000F814709|nr:hypothetical protein [Campylobacter jejuni]RTK00945.1 hypothetical protein C3H41_08730 [Campylobacter jejuni]HEF7700804.1 hypothetical protein [Campylobacter jejuni]HEF7706176.1 hypothetical protein [Campylobacter jejuni]HEF8756372.1 hypothetical protein [Campylobacter jejuni]
MIIDKRFLSNQGDTLNLNIIKWSIDVKSLLAFREDLNREDGLTQEELEQGCLKVVLFLKDLEENSLIDKYFELAKADLGEEVILNFYKNIKKDEINKARDKAIAEILYNEKVFSNNFNDRALISTFLASDTHCKR